LRNSNSKGFVMSDRKVKITVDNVCKHYGELVVLDRMTFDIHDGEFLCVVGPSGCGKTTFCNVLARLVPPTAGTITIDGEAIDYRKHNVSFVFQEPSCLPWRTVWDDVRIGLEIKGVPEAEINEKVETMLKLTGLTKFKDFYPYQISGGMKQRVAIARAFVTEPDLLLMDEPFGQLDPCTRFYIESRLIEIWKKTRRTIIFVTHNIEEAVYLAERILVCTQKPTSIKEEVIVDLPYPRTITNPGFVELRKRVTDLVRWW
jgi:sulfonate transport system ATP-binding protein